MSETTAGGNSTESKNTTCYMCACRCGIRVTLRDGEVRYIQGNPEHPLNKGVICAKGASGIMKQYSPARLTKPLKRVEGAERGAAQFEEISWDEAFQIMEDRLSHLRETDPKKFALFTGRDQMQAFTGMWASQFGTINWAAHGGFCGLHHRSRGRPIHRGRFGPRRDLRGHFAHRGNLGWTGQTGRSTAETSAANRPRPGADSSRRL